MNVLTRWWHMNLKLEPIDMFWVENLVKKCPDFIYNELHKLLIIANKYLLLYNVIIMQMKIKTFTNSFLYSMFWCVFWNWKIVLLAPSLRFVNWTPLTRTHITTCILYMLFIWFKMSISQLIQTFADSRFLNSHFKCVINASLRF